MTDVMQGKTSSTQDNLPIDSIATSQNALLSCLVFLSSRYGDQRSAESLAYGLEYEGDFTPSIYIEAAKRAGYNAKIVKYSLKDLLKRFLPCTLVLNQGHAVVLLSHKGKDAVVFDPKLGHETSTPLKDLAKDYAGYALLTKTHEDLENDNTGHSHVDIPARHWFWSVVKDNFGSYTLALLSAAFINLFALAGPLFVMNVYDRVLPSNATETGWVLAIAVLVVYLFDLVIRTLRGYFIDVASRRSDVILARKLLDQILDMKLMTRPGSIGTMSNSLREFDTIREFMTSATVVTLVDLPFSLFFIGIIWIIGGPIALMLLGVYGAVILISLLIQIPVKRMIFKSMKGSEIKHNLLLETLYNLETVKGVGGAGRLRKKYTDVVSQAAIYNQKSKLWSGLASNFTAFTQQSTSVFIILIGMYMVADQALTVGGLIACVILSTRALAPIAQIAGLINKYHHAALALRSLNKIMAIPKERDANKRFLSRPTLKGDFKLRNVSFAYPNMTHPSLSGINLDIKAGERVGIIGKIGSGKSTLVKVLMQFYDASDGSIKLDDTDIRQIDPADIRSNIAYVSQDPGLFRGTVRENITLAKPDASDEDVLRASKLAGVFDFLKQHPDGFDAMVGDNGEGFSGGQRQAISMARAFLTQPNIMVCDEPTNAMDVQSEAHLIAALKQETEGKTFILVTHKTQMLSLVDRVLVIQHGQLVADGPRDKVLELISKGLEKTEQDLQQKEKDHHNEKR